MEKTNLLILGAGQYGHIAKETAEAMNRFEKIAFLDDNSPLAIGKLAEYDNFKNKYSCAFVAMGDPIVRGEWIDKLKESGFELPCLIHPRAFISPSATLEKGIIVEAMASVNTEAVIKEGTLICVGSVVNHNSVVNAYCQIDCNAVVASNAVVPMRTKVLSGTVFKKG